jgi:hypothetical protein
MSHNATAYAKDIAVIQKMSQRMRRNVSKTNLIVEKDALQSKCFGII